MIIDNLVVNYVDGVLADIQEHFPLATFVDASTVDYSIGWQNINGVWTQPPAINLMNEPDVAGFLIAATELLGGDIAVNNSIGLKYPHFATSLLIGNWSGAVAFIADALAKNAITTDQYNAIAALAVQYNIPLFSS